MDPTREQIIALIEQGKYAEARVLMRDPTTSISWALNTASAVEAVGDRYAATDRERALTIYEEAQDLFASVGQDLRDPSIGSHLGRKIWMLKT